MRQRNHPGDIHMKLSIKITSYFLLLISYFLLPSCGGGNSPAVPVGPDLSVSELTTIRLDQLKFAADLTYDKDKVPNPVIYIRCADSDIDVACVGEHQGLDIIKKNGLVYGKIDATFVPVANATKDKCFDVKLVFVQKNSDNCPSGITSDDTIVWTSPALTLDENGVGSLLKNKIAPDDESVMAYLVSQANSLADDLFITTPQQTDDVVRIDRLYFTTPSIAGANASFKLIIKNSDETFRCEADFDSNTSGVVKEGIVYGNLGIELSDMITAGNKCTVTADNRSTSVTVSLVNSIDGANLTTDTKTLIDLVDNDGVDEKFGDSGYIRFFPIQNIQ